MSVWGLRGGSAEFVDGQGRKVGDAGRFDLLLGAGLAVDDHGDSDGLSAGFPHGGERLERRPSGCRRVFKDDDSAASDLGSFNPALHPVGFRFFADNKRVDVEPAGGGRVENRGGDGVRSHREAPDGVDLSSAEPGFLQHVEHDMPDEGRGFVVQGRSPHIDIVIGYES